MPPINSETPDVLKPYLFHGVELNYKAGAKDATGRCPWCGGENKFSVRVGDGLWRCLVCNEGTENGQAIKGGNNYTFIRTLHAQSLRSPQEYPAISQAYDALCEDRGLMNPQSLLEWGAAVSISSGEWVLPGFGADGKMNQLYRYVKIGDKQRLLATSGMSAALFGMQHWNPKANYVYICEGPWDGMALWEMLSRVKWSGDRLVATGAVSTSLAADANVISVPGCETFLESWIPLLKGKVVAFMYDSDHPRKHPTTAKEIPPAGFSGLMRAAGILMGAKDSPQEINWLKWGERGYDPSLPSGYDVRDALKVGGTGASGRLEALSGLLGRIEQAPEAWRIGGASSGSSKAIKTDKPSMELLPCSDYRTMIQAWRKAMKWTEGLDHALSSMLSSVISTMSVGDQLWFKIIGPASCGKSTLCEAVSTAQQYVLAKSTIRGFHSGFSDGEGGEDHSLISKVAGKTLVTKDGDTLLQSPNLPQILSEARDVYDTVSRTSYRNKASKDYSGIRMTWLLCGTSSLRAIDSSELGERFLDCVIMEKIDDELEDEILLRVAHRSEANMAIAVDTDMESQQDPSMTIAMQLTGGYVCYLRENAQLILGAITMGSEAIIRCARLGKFVAYMRARPSTRQDETAEREFAARLVSQHVRLSKCLAAVLNRKEVDSIVLERVTKVAMDTSRGISLSIVQTLRQHPAGLFQSTIAMNANLDEHRVKSMLSFMRKVGIVLLYTPPSVEGGPTHKPRWVLTPMFKKLYDDVMLDTDDVPF